MVNYKYYIEVIRNYEELLNEGYSEFEAAYLLGTLLPVETALLLKQGYFRVLNN
jgi:hypothetical protein